MAGTFEEFLRWPDREPIVLAEITASFVPATWTAASAVRYHASLPGLIHADLVAGGVAQRCVGVRQDGTDLLAVADAAAVEGAAGSWAWDAATGTLAIRTTTSVSPTALAVVHAQVTLYVATTGVVLDRVDGDPSTGIYYQPWLAGETPQLVSELEDLLTGQKSMMSGQITLTNGHGVWHRLLAPDGGYAWKNKRVRLLVGGRYNGQALARSQYAAIRTLRIEDASCDDTQASLVLAPLMRAAERTIPVTPYFESDYPHLGEGVRGTKKWIGYGRATIRPDLTDTSSHGVWTVADAAFQSLDAIHGVAAIVKTTGVRTALAIGTDYTGDLVGCTVAIVNAAYHWEDYDIEVDVTGKPGGSGPLNTFAPIVQDLLQTFLGVPISEIDLDAFDLAALDAPEELSLWIKSPRSLASILSTNESGLPSLERSVLGTVQQTVSGMWTCGIWDPSYDPAALLTLEREDFAVFRMDPKWERVFSTVNVHYQQDHARDEWAIAAETDLRTQYLLETVDQLDVHTYLRGVSDAQALAQRMLLIGRTMTTEIEFRERGARLAQYVAGQKVLVNFAPAPTASGRYVSEPFELLRVEVSYAPEFVVAGRLGNLHGIGKGIGHWAGAGAPDWAAASDADKVTSGYWADADGYADPGEPSSLNRSTWW